MKRLSLSILILASSLSAFAGKPLIGVTTGWNGNGSYINDQMYDSIVAAGGIPIVLPYCNDSSVTAAIVSQLDGILLPGGEDVNPAQYGEKVTADNVAMNCQRDTSDLYYIRSAMAQGIPLMGVCRGCQILNVALGGTLVQDIPTQWSGSFEHRMPADKSHDVKVLKGNGIWKYLKKSGWKVNSTHHQAVKTVGPDCRITAVAPDGVVEAFDCPKRKIIGIQSHPEEFAFKGVQPYLEIFRYFVDWCAEEQRDKGPNTLIAISTDYNGSSVVLSKAINLSLINAGGLPVLLPRCKDASVADEIAGHLAGMVLSGGEDVDPAWYDEKFTADNVEVNAPRDTSEIFYIKSALEHNVKVLGICRGCQILNVALGGTLVQDIPSQWPGSFNHRMLNGDRHELRIERDRGIWSVLKKSGCKVNSRHHQSIKDIAPGCQITATASDGIIEAFDCTERGLIGVQFHPESYAWRSEQPYLDIFREFVRICYE